jgi:hypothetical protein
LLSTVLVLSYNHFTTTITISLISDVHTLQYTYQIFIGFIHHDRNYEKGLRNNEKVDRNHEKGDRNHEKGDRNHEIKRLIEMIKT